MKRNMDLARKIMLAIEESNETPLGWIEIHVPEHTSEEVSYHIMLLHDAGLIEGQDHSDSSGYEWVACSLTWHGHEFLDAARDDTAWKRAKDTIAAKAGSVGFDLLLAVLVEETKRRLFG